MYIFRVGEYRIEVSFMPPRKSLIAFLKMFIASFVSSTNYYTSFPISSINKLLVKMKAQYTFKFHFDKMDGWKCLD